MNNLCSKTTIANDKESVKIKVTSAEIVVHGTADKPYYEIKYCRLDDGECHIGYSSWVAGKMFWIG